MKKIGIQIEKKQAEKIRKYLIENNLLIKNLKITRDKNYVYFPVKNLPNESIKYKSVNMEFEIIENIPKSYKEIIEIPEHLKEKLPTSYDVVGDIIILKIPKDLELYKYKIGNSFLKVNKNIRSVYNTSSISGEFRTRNLEIIAGEKNSRTIHKEYDLRFYLDIRKTYFSPRLAEERKRIASIVNPGEIVVDMFTGIAPFSIMIAKYASPKIVYAFDKNKNAIEFAKENIKLNNVVDKIEVFNIDSKNIEEILKKKTSEVDRIIMNLPFSAHKYLPYALQLISDNCIIHYYDMIKEKNLEIRIEQLKNIGNNHDISFVDHKVRKIKTYSPREFYIAIDITAMKKQADVA